MGKLANDIRARYLSGETLTVTVPEWNGAAFVVREQTMQQLAELEVIDDPVEQAVKRVRLRLKNAEGMPAVDDEDERAIRECGETHVLLRINNRIVEFDNRNREEALAEDVPEKNA